MVPNAPPNTLLDVKKSSYKKLSKFLEEKEKNEERRCYRCQKKLRKEDK